MITTLEKDEISTVISSCVANTNNNLEMLYTLLETGGWRSQLHTAEADDDCEPSIWGTGVRDVAWFWGDDIVSRGSDSMFTSSTSRRWRSAWGFPFVRMLRCKRPHIVSDRGRHGQGIISQSRRASSTFRAGQRTYSTFGPRRQYFTIRDHQETLRLRTSWTSWTSGDFPTNQHLAVSKEKWPSPCCLRCTKQQDEMLCGAKSRPSGVLLNVVSSHRHSNDFCAISTGHLL